MIKIYQIHLSDQDIDSINENGWASVPKGLAYSRMSLGAGKWDHDEYPSYYEETYQVDTDDLETAFRETNLWESEVSVKQIRRGRSSSVGDIFVKDGDCFIVDTFGFTAVGKYDLGV
jgi:hypothetical protein